MLGRLILRDLSNGVRSGGVWLPLAFFLLVATLFPFGVGPDSALLAATGGGLLWLAALLAALLPIERLVSPDLESGVIDQLALRGVSEEMLCLAKIIAHWLGFGPPLLLATVPASALLGIEPASLRLLLAGLAIGTPALAALGVMVAALTAGIRGAAGLVGLMVLPLAVPILIFGAGALGDASGSALKWLAAVSLVLFAIAPIAGGAALRARRG